MTKALELRTKAAVLEAQGCAGWTSPELGWQSGVVTGTEEISVENRSQENMVLFRNIQRTNGWKKD